ncbi:hypothetical protein [Kitasatospora viridis]|uniref:Integral membrane protein n=1 Tax=Kitasatospora viridis TaxID=281105 RepID=A0A561UJX5_9ACTN|nr:hypothetical protein [Kitasatospora viridis]TWF99672.1 hypothetical protein FHX73_113519 [Kitasatospora viridis]
MQPSAPGLPGQHHRTELRKDLDAAIETRRELGPEYESELVDAFLARIDSRLDARVEQRVAERLAELGHEQPRRHGKFGSLGYLPYTSLVMAVPLTGIGVAVMGGFGVVVAWAGIVGVNLAAALGGQREQEQRRRTAARSEWA